MTPAFAISVAGQDATGTIADRLLSLTVTDEDGDKADRVDLTVDNRDGRVAWPDLDARLTVALGFRETGLTGLGGFAVDGVAGEGPVQSLRITATGADLKSPIRAPRTRAWEDRTLSQIVQTIAGEAGLRPVVGASVAGVRWPYLAQTAESDLHFLTRLAADLDATAKPAGGALVVQRRGEGTNAAGEALPPPVLTPARLAEWSWRLSGRELVKSAEAEWRDPAAGTRAKVTAGSGAPKRVLRHVHASEAEARRAAEAAVARAGRSALAIQARIAGFEGGLVAGATVTLAGMTPRELDGTWHVTRVRHALDGAGLATSFDATTGDPA